MVDPPKRRFQFRRRTLLIVVTLFCVVVGGYVGSQAKIVRDRDELLNWIARNGGKVYPLQGDNRDGQPPLLRRLLGDKPIGLIKLGRPITAEDLHSIQALISEADILPEAKVERMRGPFEGNLHIEGNIQNTLTVPSGGQFGIPDQTLLKYEPLPSGRGSQ